MAHDYLIDKDSASQGGNYFVSNGLGGSGCKLKIYSGTAPASLSASITGTLLAVCDVQASNPFGSFDSTTLIATGNYSGGIWAYCAAAAASGTATHFRITNSGDTPYHQGLVGTSGSDLNLNTVSIVAGASITITTATLELFGLV